MNPIRHTMELNDYKTIRYAGYYLSILAKIKDNNESTIFCSLRKFNTTREDIKKVSLVWKIANKKIVISQQTIVLGGRQSYWTDCFPKSQYNGYLLFILTPNLDYIETPLGYNITAPIELEYGKEMCVKIKETKKEKYEFKIPELSTMVSSDFQFYRGY